MSPPRSLFSSPFPVHSRLSTPRHTLISSARLGEPDALGSLYDEFAGKLLTVAWRLTGSKADAEDVVHDVFVGLPEALRHYEERGQLGAWLSRLTARTALMRLRATQRRREASIDEAHEISSSVRAEHRAEMADLERQILGLPEPQHALSGRPISMLSGRQPRSATISCA